MEEKLVELIAKLEAVSVQVAPEVVRASLAALQLEAAFGIAMGLIAAVFGFGCWRYTIKNFLRPIDWDGNTETGLPRFNGSTMFVSFSSSVIFTIVALTNLLSKSAWVALIDPAAALALRVLH
jgi:hypothetical protein